MIPGAGLITAALAQVLPGVVGDLFKAKASANIVREEARARAVSEGIPGWSDELFVLQLVGPIVASFIPGLQVYVAHGFEVIETLPEWYVGAYLSVMAAVFGLDKFVKFKQGKIE